jgi:tetratricopeptide (TPR) repeat protein
LARLQGNYVVAQAMHEECLALDYETGYKWGAAADFGNLGLEALAQADYAAARTFEGESLTLFREIGDKKGIAVSLINLGAVALTQGDYALARTMYEESLTICKEMNTKRIMPHALLGLGLVGLVEGKLEAHEKILHSLRLRQETGEQLKLTSSLIGAAGLVLQEGNPQFAAQLLGVVDSTLNTLNAVIEPDVKFFHEGTLAKVKEELGDAEFQSAWEEGSQWSLEEAVKKVLDN